MPFFNEFNLNTSTKDKKFDNCSAAVYILGKKSWSETYRDIIFKMADIFKVCSMPTQK